MVIRHSIKELLAKNSVTRPMKYIVTQNDAFKFTDEIISLSQLNVIFL